MFREGRQFEKNRRTCEKTHLFVHRFFMKKRPRIEQKIGKSAFATKIGKKAFLLAHFFTKNRFFVIFGVPRGTPKSLKINEGVGTKWSGKPSGGHLGGFTAFQSILRLFWVHSGPLPDHFLANLVCFLIFVAVLSSSLLSCFF